MANELETPQRGSALGALSGANLAAKFGLELAGLTAFGFWGASVVEGPAAAVLAVATPAAAATVWGIYAAPRARRRLPLPARAVLELGIFALACAALADTGRAPLAAVMGAVVVANAGLMTALGQWES